MNTTILRTLVTRILYKDGLLLIGNRLLSNDYNRVATRGDGNDLKARRKVGSNSVESINRLSFT